MVHRRGYGYKKECRQFGGKGGGVTEGLKRMLSEHIQINLHF